MSKAILVLNAGSSSIKFALYTRDAGELILRFHGNLDGIGIRPHLSVTNATGGKLVDDEIPEDRVRDHRGAILSLRGFLHERFGEAQDPGIRPGAGSSRPLSFRRPFRHFSSSIFMPRTPAMSRKSTMISATT